MQAKLTAQYELYLLRKGLRKSTIQSRLFRLMTLLSQIHELTYANIETYLAKEASQGKSLNYLNAIIRVAQEYAEMIGKPLPAIDPFKNAKPKGMRVIFTEKEIELFLNCPKPSGQSTENYAKWQCFWRLCTFTGARMGEIASLSLEGVNRVDIGNGVIYLGVTKTDQRIVPIPDFLREYVAKYCQGKEMLFPQSYKGKKVPITNKEWGWDFRSRLKRCGITRKGLVPYSLRHTYITLGTRNIDVFSLMSLVGHRNPKTTMGYVHNDLEHLVEESRKHPMLNLSDSQKLNLVYEYSRKFNTFSLFYDRENGVLTIKTNKES